MLELSRFQSGEMAISKEIVSVKKIMSEIEESFEVYSEDMDVEFILTEKAAHIPHFYSNESSEDLTRFEFTLHNIFQI